MTSGRSVHPNALPNYQNAVIPENKLLRYSLDPMHPSGKHKAIVFKSALGFDQSNWEILKQSILDELPYHEAKATKEDGHGKRYKVILPINGPNGNTRDVVVTWIIKAETDYPSLDSTWVRKR
jgi:uncharacterized protein DUF6883